MTETGDSEREPNVRFHQVDFDIPDEKAWTAHEEIFHDIHFLSQISWETYAAEAEETPWKKELMNRAKTIKACARIHRNEKASELTWRRVESDVLKRFEDELHCTNCRARLWETEIRSNSVQIKNGQATVHEQRTSRDICQCARGMGGACHDNTGRNTMFVNKEDQQISLGTCGKPRPDAVIGLKCTDPLTILLQEIARGRKRSKEDRLETTCFPGEDCLFPFLVIEAKREESHASWTKIESQIRQVLSKALDIQVGLKAVVAKLAIDDASHSQSNLEAAKLKDRGLVWFLGIKGETWKVYVAYKDPFCPPIDYHAFCLWGGHITVVRNALQLLLIIDYVCDWAREIHQRNIVDDLSKLAEFSDKAQATAASVEDQSVTQFQLQVVTKASNSAQTFQSSPRISIRDFFKFFDLEREEGKGIEKPQKPEKDVVGSCVIRDAESMEYHLCGIKITKEALQSDFDQSNSWYDSLKSRLTHKTAWRMTGRTLQVIEKMWTGHDRKHSVGDDSNRMYIVRFGVSSFFRNLPSQVNHGHGLEWDQVHSLTYIAVAEDALSIVRDKAKLKARHLASPNEFLQVREDCVVKFFESVRYANVWSCLAAAAENIEMETTTKEKDIGAGRSHGSASQKGGKRCERNITWESATHKPTIAELVGQAHKKVKSNVNIDEANLPWFSYSHTWGVQQRLCTKAEGWPDQAIRHLGPVFLVYQENQLPHTPESLTHEVPRCIFYINDVDQKLPPGASLEPLMQITEGKLVQNVFVRSETRTRVVKPLEVLPQPQFEQYLHTVERTQQRYKEFKALIEDREIKYEKAWHFQRHKLLSTRCGWEPDVMQTSKHLRKMARLYGFDAALERLLFSLNHPTSLSSSTRITDSDHQYNLWAANTITNGNDQLDNVGNGDALGVGKSSKKPLENGAVDSDAPESSEERTETSKRLHAEIELLDEDQRAQLTEMIAKEFQSKRRKCD